MLPLGLILGAAALLTSGSILNKSDDFHMSNRSQSSYSVREACSFLRCSEQTIKRKIKSGEIEATLVNGKYQISADELRRLIDESPKVKEKILDESRDAEMNSSRRPLWYNPFSWSEDSVDLPLKDTDLLNGLIKDPSTVKPLIVDCKLQLSIFELETQKVQLQKRHAEKSENQDKVDECETKILDLEIQKARCKRLINFLQCSLDQSLTPIEVKSSEK